MIHCGQEVGWSDGRTDSFKVLSRNLEGKLRLESKRVHGAKRASGIIPELHILLFFLDLLTTVRLWFSFLAAGSLS